MASTNVGKIDFTVDLDGSALPAKAYRQGLTAARSFRRGYADGMKGWSNQVSAMMTQVARRAADRLANGFTSQLRRRFGARSQLQRIFADALPNDLFDRMEGSFAGLDRNVTRLNDGLATSRVRFRELTAERPRIIRLDRAISQTRVSIDRASRSTGSWWKSLPHGFRQWTLIIGAIAALSSGIAVLGSGVGSTAALVGTLGVGLVAAIGVGIAAFQGMFDAEEQVARGARDAKAAFADLRKDLGLLQDRMQGAFFETMGPGIRQLAAAIRGELGAALTYLSGATGRGLTTILEAMSSTRGARALSDLFTGLAPIVERLSRSVATFSQGLIDVLVMSMPYALRFADAIADIGDRFAEWSQSDQARARIREWFENGQAIMAPVLDLLRAAGRLLADLVTPESIARFDAFMQSLEDFMPHLRELLDVLGELGIFEILSELLNDLGDVLTPLYEPMRDLAGLIRETLVTGLEALGSVLTPIAESFGPFIDTIVAVGSVVLPPAIAAIGLLGDLLDALPDWIPAVVTSLLLLRSPLANVVAGFSNARIAISNMLAFNGRLAAANGVSTFAVNAQRGFTTLVTGARNAASGIAAAFGGPWGIGISLAVAGIVAIIGDIGKAAREQQDRLNELAGEAESAIDRITGALTAEGERTLIDSILGVDGIQKLEDAGVSVDNLFLGIKGGWQGLNDVLTPARDRIAEIQALIDSTVGPNATTSLTTAEFQALVAEMDNLKGAIGGVNEVMLTYDATAANTIAGNQILIDSLVTQWESGAIDSKEAASLWGSYFGDELGSWESYITAKQTAIKDGSVAVWNNSTSQWETAGSNITAGLGDGMMSGLQGLLSIASQMVNSVKARVKSEAQINSPSRVFHGYGVNIAEGLALGMESMSEKVKQAASGLAGAAAAGMDGLGSGFGAGFGAGFDPSVDPAMRRAGVGSSGSATFNSTTTTRGDVNITLQAPAANPYDVARAVAEELVGDYDG